MAYQTKHITLTGLILIVAAIVLLIHLKNRWLPAFRAWLSRRRIRLDGYAGVPSFQADIESGLTSDQFNLQQHNKDDSRKGLDEESKKRILQLMNEQNLTFDEARLRFTQSNFKANDVGPDGMPLDPKAVTFNK